MMDYWDQAIRVRYAETDQMGIAHHASYLVWFEEGRSAYCRWKGFSYRELEEAGCLAQVAEVYCRFRQPLRYDEQFVVRTRVKELRKRTMVFSYEVRRGEVLAALGETKHLLTDSDGRPRSLPEPFRSLLVDPGVRSLKPDPG